MQNRDFSLSALSTWKQVVVDYPILRRLWATRAARESENTVHDPEVGRPADPDPVVCGVAMGRRSEVCGSNLEDLLAIADVEFIRRLESILSAEQKDVDAPLVCEDWSSLSVLLLAGGKSLRVAAATGSV